MLLEPMQVSPPQVRVLGDYTDEQISFELYGIAAGMAVVVHGGVLANVVFNPKAPAEVVARLREDEDEGVAQTAQARSTG